MREPLTFIDLFAGAGGFSLGLNQAGLKGMFAIERDGMAFSTLEHNLIRKAKAFEWPEWLPVAAADIRSVLSEHKDQLVRLKGSVDIVVGGPPCQGFSVAGRRLEHDERNQLFKEYVKFVDLVRPRLLMFENVPGFSYSFRELGKPQIPYSSLLAQQLQDIGYEEPAQHIFDFSEFGVPQRRKRLIVCSVERGGDPTKIIELLDSNKLSRKVGVRKAISDLLRDYGEIPSPDSNGFMAGLYGTVNSKFQKRMRSGVIGNAPDSHRFARHSTLVKERFSEIIKSTASSTEWTREYIRSLGLKKRDLTALDPSAPAPTLTTLPDDYVHYEEPRILTVREYARIQSFPDWFEFKGKYTTGGKLRASEAPRYTQVANAVPPKFSEIGGEALRQYRDKVGLY
ncbi:MAG: DNA cytosine methyltransferase [Candidatus Thermoplasmatota archaeon]|nr:DNA cytosine methyltransferase [Candidatus Thermoplasmatota archaeon]